MGVLLAVAGGETWGRMSMLKIIAWGFIVLLLLSAVPLFLVTDRETGRLVAAFAAMCLAGFVVAFALDAWRIGVLRLSFGVIHRSATPRLFSAAVAAMTACGIGLIVLVLWSLQAD